MSAPNPIRLLAYARDQRAARRALGHRTQALRATGKRGRRHHRRAYTRLRDRALASGLDLTRSPEGP